METGSGWSARSRDLEAGFERAGGSRRACDPTRHGPPRRQPERRAAGAFRSCPRSRASAPRLPTSVASAWIFTGLCIGILLARRLRAGGKRGKRIGPNGRLDASAARTFADSGCAHEWARWPPFRVGCPFASGGRPPRDFAPRPSPGDRPLLQARRHPPVGPAALRPGRLAPRPGALPPGGGRKGPRVGATSESGRPRREGRRRTTRRRRAIPGRRGPSSEGLRGIAGPLGGRRGVRCGAVLFPETLPGRPGWLPTQAPHRPVRAGLPHTVPQATVLLRDFQAS
jgi:hypothetical protein